MNKLSLKSCRIKNFKAIRDSGKIEFTPLTVFIGNNGSGKSSVIEALETMQVIVRDGLDAAMVPWHGMEYVLNQAVSHTWKRETDGIINPISFDIQGRADDRFYHAQMKISAGLGMNRIFFEHELFTQSMKLKIERDMTGLVQSNKPEVLPLQLRDKSRIAEGDSILTPLKQHNILAWQFISLAPNVMGEPYPRQRTTSAVRLTKDGRNIADYLLHIREIDPTVIDGIVDAIQFVLPYAVDIQPQISTELNRVAYLQFAEQNIKVKLPGWVLSTGTLRILALLALLRHPSPPPVIFIEEIENGLDPRTIDLLVNEIRAAVKRGITQVVITTHSPYLLDLLSISQIVLVERKQGEPCFTRPAEREEVKEWAKRFSPGMLYTMGQLSNGESK